MHMDFYTLHLAVAALVGASAVAVSAYFMHQRTLAEILASTRSAEREREKYKEREMNSLVSRRIVMDDTGSDSMPEEGEDEGDEEEREEERVLSVPKNLHRLHLLPKGRVETSSSNSNRRAGLISGSSISKSPITSANAFDSREGSDDEDNNGQYNAIFDDNTLNADGENDKPECEIFQALPDELDQNNNRHSSRPADMISSRSVSGDLHGVQLNRVVANILRKEPEHESFIRLSITPTERPSPDEDESYMALQDCLQLRESYVFKENIAPWVKEVITDPSTPRPNASPFFYNPEEKTEHYFQMEDGVVHVYANKDVKEELFPVADATTFFTDLHRVLRVIAAGNIRTLCHRRLVLLEQKFNMHLMVNADAEFLAQKSAPHRDFYNVRKVDTHIHHSACMNQKHLLRFIKSKLRKEPDEVVIFRDGTYLTLKEVFESLDLTGRPRRPSPMPGRLDKYDLNVDLLDVHADKSTFHRFDKFNLKYNPCGQSRLREIFMKQENLIQGRFLAELTKEVFSELAASKYQMAEYRISIYGRKQSEWDQLASWIVNNELYSQNVVWLIQLPRLYNIYKEMGIVTSFQNILDNIFVPLFEVTVDPDSHPQLHVFLKQVVGFDLVDDESKPERRPTKHMPTPAQWTNKYNPAFSYYVYYCYANLYTLNKFRESKGMNTIKLRPHSGETGDIDHLAATFLTSHGIAHGINLRKSPVLQYLYYLAQIGLAMSPLSNNSLFLDYHRNPFPLFFLRGLNVSLSTDDPLQIHLTKEPLVEEYSVAASVWKLSSCDLCEIARNSVYQSGFSHALKSHWIGRTYYKRGAKGNDIYKTNVPHIRVKFRETIWREEMELVYLGQANFLEEIDP